MPADPHSSPQEAAEPRRKGESWCETHKTYKSMREIRRGCIVEFVWQCKECRPFSMLDCFSEDDDD